MAFRVSGTRPTRTIGECLEKAWLVRFDCDVCEREPVLWQEAALRRLPATATLGEIAARARCAVCGSTTGQLCTRQGRWGDRANHAVGGY